MNYEELEALWFANRYFVLCLNPQKSNCLLPYLISFNWCINLRKAECTVQRSSIEQSPHPFSNSFKATKEIPIKHKKSPNSSLPLYSTKKEKMNSQKTSFYLTWLEVVKLISVQDSFSHWQLLHNICSHEAAKFMTINKKVYCLAFTNSTWEIKDNSSWPMSRKKSSFRNWWPTWDLDQYIKTIILFITDNRYLHR